MIMNWSAVRGLVLRYVFLYSRTSTRFLDIFFWPAMDLLVWGFVSVYLIRLNVGANTTSGAVGNAADVATNAAGAAGAIPAAITFLIAAAILWNVLYRAQQSVTVSFLEDVWSRNFLNIFVAPVRPREFVAATYLVGFAQTLIVVAVLSVMGLTYNFNLFSLGWYIVPLFANLLIFGWAIGLMTMGLILRYGHQAEALAWAIPFLIQPLAAVFYPISVLPPWLQPVALALPPSHAFEGMRSALAGHGIPTDQLIYSSVLNLGYLIGAGYLFKYMFEESRRLGLLAKIGT
jgi:ABC-2 type transport system permease protein